MALAVDSFVDPVGPCPAGDHPDRLVDCRNGGTCPDACPLGPCSDCPSCPGTGRGEACPDACPGENRETRAPGDSRVRHGDDRRDASWVVCQVACPVAGGGDGTGVHRAASFGVADSESDVDVAVPPVDAESSDHCETTKSSRDQNADHALLFNLGLSAHI